LIDALKTTDEIERPFGEYEEEAIVSLIIDRPELFTPIFRFLKHQLFGRDEVQYVVAHILDYYEKYEVFPSRGILIDTIKRHLTVDQIGYEDIIAVAQRPSDPRDIPALKERILEWARSKAYGLIYDPETIAKYKNGDFDSLETIINQARSIQDVGTGTMWFFDEIEKCFVNEELDKFTTGFAQLNHYMHPGTGGPARKEMLVWMAPTGVGKSIMLINNAIANVLQGRNVLYITLELSDVHSAIRALGALTNKPVNARRFELKNEILAIVDKVRGDADIGSLVIHEFPPDEVSVDNIYALIDMLKKTKSWSPDVICVDYLELLRGRHDNDNRDEYSKQKAVSTQVRGVATNANVLVFTATQTNRSGNDGAAVIDITKIAESYGKTMPMDYLISITQSEDEYQEQFDSNGLSAHPAPARMYIAKNRHGEKFQTIPIRINYNTMAIKEIM
jgi:replicative DNA helicase